jgi:hypothetical protein
MKSAYASSRKSSTSSGSASRSCASAARSTNPPDGLSGFAMYTSFAPERATASTMFCGTIPPRSSGSANSARAPYAFK